MEWKTFYDETTINKLLYCPGCKRKYNEAKILPCGIYCLDCIQVIIENIGAHREFHCAYCDDTHLVPKSGFKSYEMINELNSIKPKFTLDGVYRGEAVKQLRANLKKINVNIEDLSFDLLNCLETVRAHCMKLRNDVKSETQLAKKKIDELSEDMIKQINNYEEECVINIQHNKVKMGRFEKFLEEMSVFQQEWTRYLDNYQINEKEVNEANSFLQELCYEKKFEEEKRYLDHFIFNRKMLSFAKNQKKLENHLIGDLEYRITKRINFEKDLKKSLDKVDNKYLEADILQDGRIILSQKTNSFDYALKMFGNETKQVKFANILDLKFKAFKNNVILFISQNVENEFMPNYMLKMMDSELRALKQSNLPDGVKAIGANDTNIYCVLYRPYHNILILNLQLQQMKTLGQSSEPSQSFYFSLQVKMFENRNKKYYCLFQNKLDIIDEETGMVNSTIYVSGTGKKFFFDTNGNLIIICKKLPDAQLMVYKYNQHGDYMDELEVENLPMDIDYWLDKQNNLLIFDIQNSKIMKSSNEVFKV